MDHDHTYEKQNTEGEYNIWIPSSLYDSRPTDLTLVIESWKFHVHKDILEKSSTYFSAMFSSQMMESGKDVIDLHLVSPEDFKILIEGMYTGELKLRIDNVYDTVEAAEMLQLVPSLQSKYTDFMKSSLINLDHCLELMYFCVTVNLQDLYCDVRRFSIAHFTDLRNTNSLTSLTVSELYDYLSDKYLIVEDELHVVEAIHYWLSVNKTSVPFNSEEFDNLKTQIRKLVSACVCLKGNLSASDVGAAITEAVFCDGPLPVERFQYTLAKRPREEDLFMFWALLTSTNPDGLVDVVRYSLDTGSSVKFDTMTDVVEQPGFQLGSAICASGPYIYLSGGGPQFGKANWIKQIWRFDVSKPSQRWEIIGNLHQFRRSHTMVIVKNKLYIFGGFGPYRIKNTQLTCLDLLTDEWLYLPPMPVHELNPLTTVSEHNIFYITSTWNVYVFNTIMKSWSALDLSDKCPSRLPLDSKPVALFAIKTSREECLTAAVVTATNTQIRIPLLHMHGQSLKLYTDDEEDIASFSNIFTYAGSAKVNGKVVLFMSSEKIADTIVGEGASRTIQKAVIFDPNNCKFYDMPAVQNLKKAQTIIAMPHLPSTFTMRSIDFR